MTRCILTPVTSHACCRSGCERYMLYESIDSFKVYLFVTCCVYSLLYNPLSARDILDNFFNLSLPSLSLRCSLSYLSSAAFARANSASFSDCSVPPRTCPCDLFCLVWANLRVPVTSFSSTLCSFGCTLTSLASFDMQLPMPNCVFQAPSIMAAFLRPLRT
ncbi:predicted protein [Meyerozyma guilliermondii ATCC 6260]|uniref:Uncharacterized protein n=1 Tax=Meyerozyma guilliermondii (strain ATCC 6260 / CBS 566 / DSM 6381 / JCM 1539 / NBRC 10279 / NRRL Y-324) TaxID=294746 RepID=A5DDF1_PICGU|nr:uncharacterized protein PGUG_01302 [Meyerozyma guilliermondii ATCC 6260]EDK37204.2 predicted protein [Meyerozyma guilliermondii ATCC 6260]